MGKLIGKTAAATFSLLVAFALIIFGVISLASPSAMMSFTDSMGMVGASAYYSVAAYDRSGDISDLATAVEKSYDAGHYEDAAEYGVKFLDDSDFSEYCAGRDADTQGNAAIRSSYAQYAAGIVSSAQYYTGAEEFALNTALESLGETFPQNNAAIYLAASAMEKEDTDFCKLLLERLEVLSVKNDAEQVNLEAFLSQLRAYCAA